MNLKRQRFVEAFVGEAHGNGAEAARIAGYSKHSANKIATELQTFPAVQQAIEARQKALAAKSTWTAERIAQELEAVAAAKVEPKSADKMKALELLGKWRKMWDDKSNTSEPRIIINIDYMSPTPQPRTIDVQALSTEPK